MKKLVYLFVSILMAAATSCGTKSDAETEKKLDGTWVSTESENEDGVTMRYNETLILDASTHEFDQTLTLSAYAYGEYMSLGTVKLIGKWAASKKEINFDFSEDDIDINLDKDLLSEMGGKDEVIKEIMKANGIMSIVKVSGSTLVLKDDDGEKTEYTHCD